MVVTIVKSNTKYSEGLNDFIAIKTNFMHNIPGYFIALEQEGVKDSVTEILWP